MIQNLRDFINMFKVKIKFIDKFSLQWKYICVKVYIIIFNYLWHAIHLQIIKLFYLS